MHHHISVMNIAHRLAGQKVGIVREERWDAIPGVVSPETETTATALEEATTDGLKDLLAKCALEEFLPKFVSAGVSSHLSLVGKAGDAAFMEKLVENVGLSASQAIRFQILVSSKH